MIIWHPMPGGGIGTSIGGGLLEFELTYSLVTRGYVVRCNGRQIGEPVFASYNIAKRAAEARIHHVVRDLKAEIGIDQGWDRYGRVGA